MINRTLVRAKVIQTLFAYYKDGESTPLMAKKALLKSFDDTYSLYFLLLDFVNEMTTMYEELEALELERASVLHKTHHPQRNFINNRFAQQIFNNRQLRGYLKEKDYSWDVAHESLRLLFKQIIGAEFFAEYQSLPYPSYADDKQVWRRIFTDVLADNVELEAALDELEVALDGSGWTVDANVVISYVIKTIKRFTENSGKDQSLLEMFNSEEELAFAKELLQKAIEGHDEYLEMIEKHLHGWDLKRVADMDLIILQTALAEIVEFPSIALQVSINEYLELAKEYSTEKSSSFVNGMLDSIIADLKAENKLLKAVTIES